MNNSWGLGGGFMSGPNGGSLDLEPPMHRHHHTQLAHPSSSNQHQINLMTVALENDHQFIRFHKGKAPAAALDNSNASDEEGPNLEDGNGDNPHGGKGKKGNAPWQRMKWTDDVVRLLIAVVACVGDDGALDGVEGLKRKPGMIFQKKGKWKTVSKIMIKKGCHVSPQQCEDKFNDLNKRYKRLNDILGRGTTCRVVENPALLDSMPQLSAKAKDDVRKILSSKHLFYKEMCAYHNGQRIPNCQDLDLQGYSLHLEKESNGSGDEGEGNDDDDSDDDDDSENEDEDNADGNMDRMESYGEGGSGGRDSFEFQMAGMFRDPSKSAAEQKEWIKWQKLQLQEKKVQIQAQSFELERQRFKWQRYCSKKQRELERMRLENERMNLESEWRELQLKQKELEMGPKRSNLIPRRI
ncbi:uncharacterized protein LOC116211151 [Punica granatum]|uniref:Myb/SANT-like DNA-binding domain-containing protein n=2 Tax=Punica granatum TaxID=22663 RepID=A0A218W9Q5_PUNGR|nr:uncharacterized protein LOC116211151 [Punica granatum]OWM69198.1 hypothetical protein CDL15_Pgr025385 [Punica granatum]PKI42525.1 hypothetical protein CRG98_037114 [Punica granatum]